MGINIKAATHLQAPSAAYVHIPFCKRRCYYCDFPIYVVGDRARGDSSNTISNYVEVLCQEIAATPAKDRPLKTVFFGGGTPSLLSVNQLGRILTALDRQFGIEKDAEISQEMDPGTFTVEQLQGYLAAGVNRVSLGVQAFEPELLQICGRSHTQSDIWAAIEIFRLVGIDNFSLDLISGLPHQTLQQWQTTLETAMAIAPSHISVYDLIIEPATAFNRYYQPGIHPLPTDDMTAEMYRQGRQVLTSAGYEHYEISNYALSDRQCRHNRVYWENRTYYGFGMGAASYTQGQRFTRPRTTKAYYQWVQEYKAAAGWIDYPQTPLDEVLLDTLMLGLRLQQGVKLSTLTEVADKVTLEKVWTCLQPFYQQGWVELVGIDGTILDWHPSIAAQLRLTAPEGFLFSNVVLAALFAAIQG